MAVLLGRRERSVEDVARHLQPPDAVVVSVGVTFGCERAQLVLLLVETARDLDGEAEPDTERCVDIATRAALKKMILPGVLAVGAPVVVGFGLGAEALGGMLGGALVACVLLALTMANAGGAWDNAKKHIEKGNLGGKGSDGHKAAVVGDTVGDPFKDTTGPSLTSPVR